ncbi:hypothetical protein SNR26_07130 [Pectobacterium brasiliense]|uniref:hypothetical protein n=1 Tax=Pectobacterium brasiliense TaxID=180957 RepID=UPI002A817FD9|nr:hypothetical protein [Pectobacterium brasiliense]MDY4367490.1 hypothetical protein [Pectobacterium brasiliense]MDY7057021.1 hypothetical protein [Pectobacterium brasiliense]
MIAQKYRLKSFSALFAPFHQEFGIVWKDWSNEKRVTPYLASDTGQQLQIHVKKSRDSFIYLYIIENGFLAQPAPALALTAICTHGM